MSGKTMTLTAVGEVISREGRFAVRIRPEFRSALKELAGWSHVQILWWGHLVDTPEYRQDFLVAPKPYRKGPEEIGIFATRSPVRPNPVELTSTILTGVDEEEGLIELAYIDAEDGTPVIDVKPYVPATERIRDAGSPGWAADWPTCLEDSATFDWGEVFENAR